MFMKNRKFALTLAVFLAGVIGAGFANVAKADPAEKLPSPAVLQGLLGGKLSAADLKDKVVVLQFFASWCVGCEKTMHDMVGLTGDHKNVIFVPVSVDEDVKSARTFFTNKSDLVKSLESKSYVDPTTDFAARLNIKAVPSVIIIGNDGAVSARSTGHPSKERLIELQAAMNGKATNASVQGATH